MKILFVCTGNICRSPAAEAIMKKKVEKLGIADRFTIDSAGTHDYHEGELPDERMREAAAKRGYELTSRARVITDDDFSRFDLILSMDKNNSGHLVGVAPGIEAMSRLREMVEFSRKPKIKEIPDPYYGGASGFERVLDLLEDAIDGLLERRLS